MTRIAWHTEWRGDVDQPVLALVHGFAGSLATWNRVAPLLETNFHLLLIDLPGHGRTPLSHDAMSIDTLADELGHLLMRSARLPVFLAGYSMGGRIALHLALRHPEMVRALALLGASPGIENAEERAARMRSDQELADQIVQSGTEWFADYWASQPLFSSQNSLPLEVRNDLREQRRGCQPEGLAFALRNWSTGAQEYLMPQLLRIRCPVLLLAGELDERYCASNQVMELAIRDRANAVVIPQAGHAAHIENPDGVADAIHTFFVSPIREQEP